MEVDGYEITWWDAAPHRHFTGYQELAHQATWGQPRSFLLPMVDHVVRVLDGVEAAIGTGEDGLEAVRVLDAVERSLATGRWEDVCRA